MAKTAAKKSQTASCDKAGPRCFRSEQMIALVQACCNKAVSLDALSYQSRMYVLSHAICIQRKWRAYQGTAKQPAHAFATGEAVQVHGLLGGAAMDKALNGSVGVVAAVPAEPQGSYIITLRGAGGKSRQKSLKATNLRGATAVHEPRDGDERRSSR